MIRMACAMLALDFYVLPAASPSYLLPLSVVWLVAGLALICAAEPA